MMERIESIRELAGSEARKSSGPKMLVPEAKEIMKEKHDALLMIFRPPKQYMEKL
jgi:hypothetical protein